MNLIREEHILFYNTEYGQVVWLNKKFASLKINVCMLDSTQKAKEVKFG